MINKIFEDAENNMKRCFDVFKNNINRIHTNRASPNLLDNIKVEYYGQLIPLRQLANITTENSSTLAITVFEKELVTKVKRAITNSDLELNVFSKDIIIHVSIPSLNEERRRNLVKIVRYGAEQGRISIRNARRDANDQVKLLMKNKIISEDEDRRFQFEIQKLTNIWIKNLENTLIKKEEELMKI